ncbi:MAG: hypothetical protein ACOZNI_22080 [Myxococcota bacterium]
MLRRLLRTLVLLLAVIGLCPGVSELVENLGELAEHGHFAHEVAEAPARAHAEHGCTAMSHGCGCHASSPALPTVAPVLPVPGWQSTARPHHADLRGPARSTPPPVRPPIA